MKTDKIDKVEKKTTDESVIKSKKNLGGTLKPILKKELN